MAPIWGSFSMAEGEGFEPSVPCGTLVFKTSSLNHSDILPLDIVPFLWQI